MPLINPGPLFTGTDGTELIALSMSTDASPSKSCGERQPYVAGTLSELSDAA
jgi:hypothetical protein